MSQAQLDIQQTLGAWFIGAIASVGLMGITTLQCWTYFLRFPGDPNILKALVLAVWALLFTKCTMSIHASYFLAIVKWCDVSAISSPLWSMKAMLLFSSATMLLVHLFFAHKVWMLTHKRYWWITIITLLFTIGQFVLGIATFVSFVKNNNYEVIILGGTGKLATAAMSCAIVADWTITISLVIFFRAGKGSQTQNLSPTKKILNTLIFYTVNVGLLISVVDFIVLILQNVKFASLNLYQLTFYEIVGDLYANTLLACLNMRSAPSGELPRVVKLHQGCPSSRVSVYRQSLSTCAGTRPSSMIQGDEQDRFVMGTGKKTGEMLDPSPAKIGLGEMTKSGSIRLAPDWASKRAGSPSDVVITRTTERHTS